MTELALFLTDDQTWTVNPALFAQAPDEFNVDEWLKTQGWEEFLSLGEEGTFQLRVLRHRRSDDELTKTCLVEVTSGDSYGPYMEVANLPAALDLVARWIPILNAYRTD